MALERDLNFKLIALVKKKPCLYNYTIAEYSRKDVTEMAWEDISAKLKLSVHDCKDKWKNMRSAFVRSLKSKNRKTKRPYYLHDYMYFLLPYVKTTKGSESQENSEGLEDLVETQSKIEFENNVVKSEADPDPLDVYWNDEDDDDEINDESNLDEVASTSSIFSKSSVSLKRKRSKNEIDKKNGDTLQTIIKRPSETMNAETANKYFLLSLLHELNDLNQDQLRTFKIKVLLLIENIQKKNTFSTADTQ